MRAPLLSRSHRRRLRKFIPTDIDGLDLWLRADRGLFTDSGAATPVTSDGDVVGTWQDQSGNNNDFTQGTTAKKPLFKVKQINGEGVVRFEGTDDILVASNFSSALEGTVFITYQLTAALQDFQNIFSTSDEALDTKFFGCRSYEDGASPNVVTLQRSADTQDKIKGNTVISTATAYVSIWRSNGTVYTIRVNGNDETLGVLGGANNGDWFGDTADRDNFTVGGTKRTSEGIFFKGDVRQILSYDTNLTGTDLANVEAFLARDAGIVLT